MIQMNHFNRLSQTAFVLFVFAQGLAADAAAKPRIIPVRTTVSYSSHLSEPSWSIPIKTTDGSTLYILSLEQGFAVGHSLAVLKLVLRHFTDRPDAPNLLDPSGIWHGIQPCDFVANDLAKGIQKSVFGEKRKLSRKDLGLVVRITVRSAIVSVTPSGNYQLDGLGLQIEVDNTNS